MDLVWCLNDGLDPIYSALLAKLVRILLMDIMHLVFFSNYVYDQNI